MGLTEKCGLIGIYGNTQDAARLVYYGLWALQHRGQESSGICCSGGDELLCHKGTGLVAHVYNESAVKALKGNIAIGHNRYSTFGKSTVDHSQPVYYNQNNLALAHNGNLPDVSRLLEFLTSKGISTTGFNDSELMFKAIEYYCVMGMSAQEAVKLCYPLFTGAFCLLILTKNELIAVRDSKGIRPLSLGKINGTYVISSETCALDAIGAVTVRDIAPGEMVTINNNGLESHTIQNGEVNLDVFEFIYFARPDSTLLGKSVYTVRKNLGAALADETAISADMVIPVPDTAIPAALGYAQNTKVPFEQVLVKNRYIHRTFIKPSNKQRTEGVKMKLNLIAESVKNKRVILIDDSIVRGTTSKHLVSIFRDCGVKEIHMLITSPPVLYPDFYGINTPSQSELIASQMTHSELENYLCVDSLHYLSFTNMVKAIGVPVTSLCTSCFTGEYPIGIGDNSTQIKPVEHYNYIMTT